PVLADETGEATVEIYARVDCWEGYRCLKLRWLVLGQFFPDPERLTQAQVFASEHAERNNEANCQRRGQQPRRSCSTNVPAQPLMSAFAHRGFRSVTQRQVAQLPFEIFLELGGALITLLGPGLQTAFEDCFDCRGHRRVSAAQA